LTAEGFRPYPLTSEIQALCQGKPTPITPRKIETHTIVDFPLLVTASWCPFTSTANDFWNETAQAVGTTLTTVDAESEDGIQVMASASVAGVPCLIVTTDRRFYGLGYNASEAMSLLHHFVL
jgi:hypothetical protein